MELILGCYLQVQGIFSLNLKQNWKQFILHSHISNLHKNIFFPISIHFYKKSTDIQSLVKLCKKSPTDNSEQTKNLTNMK